MFRYAKNSVFPREADALTAERTERLQHARRNVVLPELRTTRVVPWDSFGGYVTLFHSSNSQTRRNSSTLFARLATGKYGTKPYLQPAVETR